MINMKTAKYVLLSVSVLSFLFILSGCTNNKENEKDSSSSAIDRIYSLDPQRNFIGETVDDFHFIDIITNKQIHLDELYKDKIVFIQSFSVGCPACVQGIIDYNYLYDKYKGKIEVIYMDINPDDSKEVILNAKEEFNGKNWLWAKYQGSLLPFYENFNVKMNDMTFILDKNGKIAYADSFSVPLSRLENALKEII